MLKNIFSSTYIALHSTCPPSIASVILESKGLLLFDPIVLDATHGH